jgi:hypothetical protein
MTAVSLLLAMMLVWGERPGPVVPGAVERGTVERGTVEQGAQQHPPTRDSHLAGDSAAELHDAVVGQDEASRTTDDEQGSPLARRGLVALPSIRASEAGYIHLRNVALRMGTEAMGQTYRASGAPQPTYWELTSALGVDPPEVQPPPEPSDGEPQSGVESLPDLSGATAGLSRRASPNASI